MAEIKKGSLAALGREGEIANGRFREAKLH
jgi:hypothetical protein